MSNATLAASSSASLRPEDDDHDDDDDDDDEHKRAIRWEFVMIRKPRRQLNNI